MMGEDEANGAARGANPLATVPDAVWGPLAVGGVLIVAVLGEGVRYARRTLLPAPGKSQNSSFLWTPICPKV